MTTPMERFMAKVEPEPNTGCWLWAASMHTNGQAQFEAHFPEGRLRSGHRVSYRLFHGPLNGLWVCHHCDTPSCVNPDHLFLGTPKDNMQDARRKGRLWFQWKTHCHNGHERTPDNIHIVRRRSRSDSHICKICYSAHITRARRKHRARLKLMALPNMSFSPSRALAGGA